MAIIRWSPWNLQSMLDEDWELPTIPGVSRLMGQGLNLYETDDAIVAQAALPGITEDKIDVSIEDGIVRITAHSEEKEEEKDKRRYFMTSLATSFNYSFRLPQGIVTDEEPKAELDNGVLHLTFRKVQKAEPKKIKVAKKAKEIAK
ncbi:MAG TPA: Hsp20/alpha crystallin family protein [Patescibacteria group bacterium]|nr:Hsp20/alpha crystallin family protein [Patescibacteria group bacterium]